MSAPQPGPAPTPAPAGAAEPPAAPPEVPGLAELTGLSAQDFADAAARLGFAPDAAQRRAIDRLLAGGRRGSYLVGPVGRGKSWLLNTVAGRPGVRRVHAHEFFRELHAGIFRTGFNLDAALDELLGDARVLCFDEFQVHDVADARLLARFVAALGARPIRLLITSNAPPEALLPHPGQHPVFLPTIAWLLAELEVLPLDAGRDYRLDAPHERGFAAGAWLVPGSAAQLSAAGAPASEDTGAEGPGGAGELRVDGRPIAATGSAAGTPAGCLRIDFAALCEAATAPGDYLALAERFPTWVLAGVPDLARVAPEAAQRFANAIDVLVDRDVRLFVLAATPAAAIARAPEPPLHPERLLSRLALLRGPA